MPIRRRRCSAMRDSAILYRGALTAQTQKRQLRLTAPFFHNTSGISHAGWIPNPTLLRAALRRRAILYHQLRSRQVGRRRPHKPSMSGFDSRLRYQSRHWKHGTMEDWNAEVDQKSTRSNLPIFQSSNLPIFHFSNLPDLAARSFRRSSALQAGERGAKPRRSTFFNRARGSQRTRLIWNQEKLRAALRRATILILLP